MTRMIHIFGAVALMILVSGMPACAERLTVDVPVANIRSGPGENYAPLWKVERYYPVSVLKKSGEWYYFTDFEGDEGWIHQSVVRTLPAVITARDKCNVRSGPGTRFDILFTVEKGIPFKVVRRKGDWIRIEHADGDKGWIYKSLVW